MFKSPSWLWCPLPQADGCPDTRMPASFEHPLSTLERGPGGEVFPCRRSDADIRRRYARSVRNFLELYRPVADWWEVFDNSYGQRALLAVGSGDEQVEDNPDTWDAFVRSADAD